MEGALGGSKIVHNTLVMGHEPKIHLTHEIYEIHYVSTAFEFPKLGIFQVRSFNDVILMDFMDLISTFSGSGWILDYAFKNA